MVRAVRTTLAVVAEEEGVKPLGMRDFAIDAYAQLDGTITDAFGQEVRLATQILDPSDAQIDAGLGARFDEALREFFRQNIARPDPNARTAYVTSRWHHHFAVVGTIIGAFRPDLSSNWPRRVSVYQWVTAQTPANDNWPTLA